MVETEMPYNTLNEKCTKIDDLSTQIQGMDKHISE